MNRLVRSARRCFLCGAHCHGGSYSYIGERLQLVCNARPCQSEVERWAAERARRLRPAEQRP